MQRLLASIEWTLASTEIRGVVAVLAVASVAHGGAIPIVRTTAVAVVAALLATPEGTAGRLLASATEAGLVAVTGNALVIPALGGGDGPRTDAQRKRASRLTHREKENAKRRESRARARGVTIECDATVTPACDATVTPRDASVTPADNLAENKGGERDATVTPACDATVTPQRDASLPLSLSPSPLSHTLSPLSLTLSPTTTDVAKVAPLDAFAVLETLRVSAKENFVPHATVAMQRALLRELTAMRATLEDVAAIGRVIANPPRWFVDKQPEVGKFNVTRLLGKERDGVREANLLVAFLTEAKTRESQSSSKASRDQFADSLGRVDPAAVAKLAAFRTRRT